MRPALSISHQIITNHNQFTAQYKASHLPSAYNGGGESPCLQVMMSIVIRHMSPKSEHLRETIAIREVKGTVKGLGINKNECEKTRGISR